MKIIDLAKITFELEETIHFVTREFGQIIIPVLEKAIRESDDSVVVLDFANIGFVDFSCPNEVFGHLIPNLKTYGDKYLLITNLNNGHRENVSVGLTEDKLAIAELTEHEFIVMGHLPKFLDDLLKKFENNDSKTAREIADEENLQISTVSSKLLSLWRMGLIQRREVIIEEGKHYLYKSLSELF